MSDVRNGGARGDAAREAPAPSAWHWITAGLGLVIVLVAFGYLVHDAVRRRGVPHPLIAVATDTVVATPAGYMVRVQARNDGGVAAADLLVRGDLQGADGTTESREATIDYVPPFSSGEAGLVFEGDPRAGRLVVRAVGFDIP